MSDSIKYADKMAENVRTRTVVGLGPFSDATNLTAAQKRSSYELNRRRYGSLRKVL